MLRYYTLFSVYRRGNAIHATIKSHGLSSELVEIEADLGIDVFSYELVFIGAPVYNNLGPQPVMKFLQRQKHRAANLPAAPEKPGHFAVMFCTFGGGHTGIGEAIPLLKYMGQAFENEGIRVVEEWPVVGDFPEIKNPYYNTAGRLGDVTGRPNDYDLRIIASFLIKCRIYTINYPCLMLSYNSKTQHEAKF